MMRKEDEDMLGSDDREPVQPNLGASSTSRLTFAPGDPRKIARILCMDE